MGQSHQPVFLLGDKRGMSDSTCRLGSAWRAVLCEGGFGTWGDGNCWARRGMAGSCGCLFLLGLVTLMRLKFNLILLSLWH